MTWQDVILVSGVLSAMLVLTRVDIIGGASSPGMVRIMTSTHAVTASYHQGEITAHHEEGHSRPAWATWMLEQGFPVPRLLRLVLFLWIDGTIWMRLGMLGAGGLIIFHRSQASWASLSGPRHIAFWALTGIVWASTIWFLYATRPWHAAEHQAIAAYWTHESTAFSTIAAMPREQAQCGGRFLAPLLLVIAGSALFRLPWWGCVLALEGALWIDYAWGFGQLPIFRSLTWAVQHYLTTAPPHTAALHTAQHALTTLIGMQDGGNVP